MVKLDIPPGARFGRLTVVGEAAEHLSPSGQIRRRFKCLCACGNVTVASLSDMRRGSAKSCGCLSAEKTRERSTTHGHTVHGHRSIYYRLWTSVKSRAVFRNSSSAKTYLHVSMYQPWIEDFCAFYEYVISTLGERPSGLSLDRLNTKGDYEPGNLRWATQKEQNRNKRNNRLVNFNGESWSVSEWAEKAGLSTSVLHRRLFKLGWSVERALTTPATAKQKN